MSNKNAYKKTVKLRQKKLLSGEISLYLDIYLGNGKRDYEFLGIHFNSKDKVDKREKLAIANEIRVKREIELIASDNGIISTHKKRSNFVEYFEKISIEKNEIGQRTYVNTLYYLKEFTKGHIAFSSIDETFLEDFKSFLLTKVKNNTAHSYFSVIKASLNRAVKEKVIHKNVAQNVKQIPKKDAKRIYLTIEELNKLNKTECSNIQVKYAFIFSCNTGLRLSDVKRITWNDLLNDEKKLILTQKKTEESLYLPLNYTAISILSKIKNNKIQNINNNIFNLPSNSQINKTLKEWVNRANINKKVSFHTSRHTFATMSLTSGTDLYTVSKLLGHKDIKNTQIYAKVVDESMKNAVNNIPEIDVI